MREHAALAFDVVATRVMAVLTTIVALSCALPAPAAADPVPTITLDRDGPVTLLVQSKSAVHVLGLAVASPSPAAICSDCRGGETGQLGTLGRGTEVVLRLEDGEKTFLSTDPAHARIDHSGGTWRIGWDDSAGDGDFQDLVVTVAIPGLPPPPDQDGDGVSPPADCVDTNSSVRPGAPEIPANGLDDDCVGGDHPGKINAVVTIRWAQARPAPRLLRLEVRDAPPSARIDVRCRGKRCRFTRRKTVADRAGRARLLPLVPKRLGRGTTLDVSITAPNMIGKVRRYRVRRTHVTSGTTLCLPPAAPAPVSC
jgi:hypothetical protein